MVRVMKSPNIISTTGRRPVMAAPTATPVKPASEIGVSTTRLAPNSSSRPERTLNGVPASATSSPMMQTRESRRISSARASRTAWANVSSRSGIDVLLHFIDVGKRLRECKLPRLLHGDANFSRDSIKGGGVSIAAIDQPLRQDDNGIAIGLPLMLFLLGTVVFAIDIADVMSAVAVGIALQEGRPVAGTSTLYQPRRDFIHGAHVLTINARGLDTEGSSTAEDGTRRGLLVMRVLVVHIIFANIDYRQLPQLRQVHHFVKRSLPESAFSEEADCNATGAESLRGKSCSRGNAHAAADDSVGAEIAGRRIGDVHRSTFASTIARFFSQQFGEHAIGRGTLGQAMSMAAVRAGDVVVDSQRLADPHGNGFFAAIQMGEPRHESARINLIHLLFKQADARHLAVSAEPFFFFSRSFVAKIVLGGSSRHIFLPPLVTGVDTPDRAASTSNMQAKSYFVHPMPRAAVRISLLTAVLGRGTSS